ncbi:uncharacterized protein [Aegilops tauschii subsp. strangulata]|uniref:uncharacterized protein n=1 Tax=Aegilops tauschii subsp. strangulata TaxID=200361 RepID=UPI003CC8A059
MAAVALRAQLNTLVTSMFAMGMVDEYFQYLQSIDEDGSSAPGFVAKVINLFITNANRILNDIAGLLFHFILLETKVEWGVVTVLFSRQKDPQDYVDMNEMLQKVWKDFTAIVPGLPRELQFAHPKGMVDEYFQYLQSMDDDGSSGPGLVTEVINLFIANTNRILNDIAGLMNQPMDFNKVDDPVHQLKGCSCR